MRDVREEMIQRVLYLLQHNVPGVNSTWRNRGDMPHQSQFPAIVLLDGDDTKAQTTTRKGIVAYTDSYYTAHPEVFVIAKIRDQQDNLTLDGQDNPIGPEMSAWRMKINSALLNDETLVALVENGQVDYNGYETDLKSGSTIGLLGAQLKLKYALTYPLRSDDLIDE